MKLNKYILLDKEHLYQILNFHIHFSKQEKNDVVKQFIIKRQNGEKMVIKTMGLIYAYVFIVKLKKTLMLKY